MDFKSIKKILVIKLRHIGDVLLTVPVFRALRENFPNAKITALVNSGTEEVLSGNPLIDEILVFDRGIKRLNLLEKYAGEFSFLKRIRAAGFDMVIDLTSGDRAALISLLSGARYRLADDPGKSGFIGKKYLYTHLANKNGSRHMVLQNLDIVKQSGISTDDLTVDFSIPEDAKRYAKKIFNENNVTASDKVVHIHPTSRWLFKCWKDEYMAEVINRLLEKKIKVIVTSAPDKKEMDKANRILSLLHKNLLQSSDFIGLCGKTNIKQLAAIAMEADVFLGVDSAPMHIAAAVGTPVIALFGPTGENNWGPWGKNHIVLAKNMDCKPCKRGVCDGLELRKCLEVITVDEVMDALSGILSLSGKKRTAIR